MHGLSELLLDSTDSEVERDPNTNRPVQKPRSVDDVDKLAQVAKTVGAVALVGAFCAGSWIVDQFSAEKKAAREASRKKSLEEGAAAKAAIVAMLAARRAARKA